jgi:glycosyltransferase involved in cell wall biosynthesis
MKGREPVLLVSGDFVCTGGMDSANYYLAAFLARRELPVHIVSHNVAPELLAHRNVVWHRAVRPFESHLIGERILRRVGLRVASQLAPEHVRVLVNGGNCPLPGVNWVHYVHAAVPPQSATSRVPAWKNRIARRLFLRDERTALNRAKLIIANSERTKNDLIIHYDLPSERIRLVYYGTNPSLFYPVNIREKHALREQLLLPRDKFLFLFVGALGDSRKGFDTLFKAWEVVGTDFRAASGLIVVGQGNELPLWRQRAATLPGGHSIHFLGFRKDVPDIIRACDAFALPTRYESYGLAVAEALCCGIPAIVSRHAGIAERFPDTLSDLLLSDCEDVAEMVRKLRHLRSRYDELLAAADKVSVQIRSHTWDNMAESIHTALSTVE